MQGNRVAREGIYDEHIEVLRALAVERGAGVAVGEGDCCGGIPQIGEQILRDGVHQRIDLVEADMVAGMTIGSQRSRAKADDSDVAGAWNICAWSVAAEAQSEADAGIDRVVGGWRAAKAVAEDLRSMLNRSVEQHPFWIGSGGDRLLYAEGSVEVANLEDGIAGVRLVQHDGEEKKEYGCCGPEQTLGPPITPGDRDRNSGGKEKRDGEVVICGEEEWAGDADEEGSACSASCDEQVEKSRLGAAVRPPSIGFRVAEEAGEE